MPLPLRRLTSVLTVIKDDLLSAGRMGWNRINSFEYTEPFSNTSLTAIYDRDKFSIYIYFFKRIINLVVLKHD